MKLLVSILFTIVLMGGYCQNNADSLLKMGDYKAGAKDYKNALVDCEKALTLTTVKVIDAYRCIAECYFGMENYQQALLFYQKIAVLDSSDLQWIAYRDMGRAKTNMKDYDGALQDFNKAIEVAQKNKQAIADIIYDRGDVYLETGRYKEAIKDYTNATPLQYLKFKLGKAYHYNKDYKKAVSVIMESQQFFPDFPAADIYIGLSYAALGQYNTAIRCYQTAIKKSAGYTDAFPFRQLGLAYDSLKTYNMAAHYYGKAIAINGNDPEVYKSRGRVNYELKKYKEVIADMNKVMELKPGYAEAYFYRGKAKFALLDAEGACLDLKKAAEMGITAAIEFTAIHCK